MTRFVLDCSVTMGWCFEDEADEYAESVLERLAGGTALVPALWPLEVANILLGAERRRRLTEAHGSRFLELLGQLPIVVAEAPDVARASALVALGRAHGLSAYDAAYLDLALREAIPLATRDTTLGAAARKTGVEILAP